MTKTYDMYTETGRNRVKRHVFSYMFHDTPLVGDTVMYNNDKYVIERREWQNGFLTLIVRKPGGLVLA